MKILNKFLRFITGLLTVISMILGVYHANKSTPNYDEGCYCLLLATICYLTYMNFNEND